MLILGFLFFLFTLFLVVLGSVVIGMIRGDKELIFTVFKGVGIFFGLILFAIIVSQVKEYFTGKMHVDKEDIYGSYIIDRTRFPGKNAEWQYQHYRFEITEPDGFAFHCTNYDKVVKTYIGKVEFTTDNRPHIKLQMQYPDGDTCHVLRTNPTLYREPFSFYYVFESPKYGNMFFKNGEYR